MLLAAAVAAIGGIVVALITALLGGSSGTTVGIHPPSSSSPVSTSAASVAISGVADQPNPPPPGRKYVWTGTVRGLPPNASVFMIDKRPGTWLVSPQASIAADGTWTVTWVIPAPPASADWVAVVFLQPVSGVCVPPDCSPGQPASPSPDRPVGSGLDSPVSSVPGVIAAATYHPQAKPAPSPAGLSAAAAAGGEGPGRPSLPLPRPDMHRRDPRRHPLAGLPRSRPRQFTGWAYAVSLQYQPTSQLERQ